MKKNNSLKQKNLTREKAIKLYWKTAKERCPFQEEEMINSFLEGFIDCAEYLLLQNTELEKENAELKDNFKIAKDNEYEYSSLLIKAKEIIKTFLGFAEAFGYSPSMDKFITEAEQFLKDSEVEK